MAKGEGNCQRSATWYGGEVKWQWAGWRWQLARVGLDSVPLSNAITTSCTPMHFPCVVHVPAEFANLLCRMRPMTGSLTPTVFWPSSSRNEHTGKLGKSALALDTSDWQMAQAGTRARVSGG